MALPGPVEVASFKSCNALGTGSCEPASQHYVPTPPQERKKHTVGIQLWQGNKRNYLHKRGMRIQVRIMSLSYRLPTPFPILARLEAAFPVSA